MSDLFLLRPQQFREVESVRGCNPTVTEYTPVDPAVWYGMDLQPQETACLRSTPFNDAAFASWSWDMTSCVAMLPFTVSGWTARGVFTQISSYAAALNIEVGSPFTIQFGPIRCAPTVMVTHSSCAAHYVLTVLNARGDHVVHQQRGAYNWTRVMRTDPNDGMGGANMQASVQFTPSAPTLKSPLHDWGSIWIARERFSGSWQSVLGFATFDLLKPPHAKTCDEA
jgi:hypothetical protein